MNKQLLGLVLFALGLILTTGRSWANDPNRPQPVNEGPWAVTQMRFANDGKRLVVNVISLKRRGPGLVQGWDVRTGRVLFRRVLPQWQDVVFSPDGRLYATFISQMPNSHELTNEEPVKFPVHSQVIETATGKVLSEVKAESGAINPIAFSPDGKLLIARAGPVANTGFGLYEFFDTATGKPVRKFAENRAELAPAAFSGDGQLVAIQTGGTKREPAAIEIRRVDSGERINRFTGPNFDIQAPLTLSHDGKLLAFSPQPNSRGFQTKNITLWNTQTGARHQTLGFGQEDVRYHGLRFSRDGNRLTALGVSLGRSPFLETWTWDTTTGKVLGTLDPRWPSPMHFLTTDLSPDGKLIAMAGNQSPIQLRTLQEGEIVRELELVFPESQNSKW